MATRTRSIMVLVALVVAGFAVAIGASRIADAVLGPVIADPVLIGTDNSRLMMSSEDAAEFEDCPAAQVLADHHCGNLKVVIINAALMPFIARNIQRAWADGEDF